MTLLLPRQNFGFCHFVTKADQTVAHIYKTCPETTATAGGKLTSLSSTDAQGRRNQANLHDWTNQQEQSYGVSGTWASFPLWKEVVPELQKLAPTHMTGIGTPLQQHLALAACGSCLFSSSLITQVSYSPQRPITPLGSVPMQSGNKEVGGTQRQLLPLHCAKLCAGRGQLPGRTWLQTLHREIPQQATPATPYGEMPSVYEM